MADSHTPPVTFEHYAFVTAGLSDGLGLDELLEHLDIDPHAWPRAEAYWIEVLTRDAEQGALKSLELGELQASARQAWARAVPPLDDDLRAWVDFQRLLTAKSDPVQHLRSLGLVPADLLRIQALWTERLSADADLRSDLAAHMQRSPEPVEVHPPVRPSLKPAKDGVNGTGFYRSLDDTGDGLPFADAHGSNGVALRQPPPVLAPLPPPPRRDEQGIDATAALGLVFESLTLPFGQAPCAEAVPPTPAPQLEPLSGGLHHHGVAQIPLVVSVQTQGHPVDTTAVGGVAAVGNGLPFSGAHDPPPSAADLTAHPGVGSTAFLDASSLGLDAQPPPSVSSIDVTAEGGVAPVSDPVPFRGEATPPPPVSQHPHRQAGGTAASISVRQHDRPLPFVAANPGESALVAGGLTWRQFAAVTVELELSFGSADAVLAAYGLTTAGFREHNAAVQAITARNPAAAARWLEAKATYARWKAEQSR